MLIIGERINTSRKDILEAVTEQDTKFIQEEAIKQVEAGATMIDVNAAMMIEKESEILAWLVKVVQDAVDITLSIDSSNPAAIEKALKVHRGKALVNSISLELDRYQGLIHPIKEYDCLVAGLCLDERGIPNSSVERAEIALNLVKKLIEDGVKPSDIYIDPLITTLSTDPKAGQVALETIRNLKTANTEVHIIVGLSNISFGLPVRRVINRAFLSMCMALGADAIIFDPLDQHLIEILLASHAILGQDKFCLNYIDAFRKGKIKND
jgi:5-methyltetrahydrofolate--homocysteine methyltransferase